MSDGEYTPGTTVVCDESFANPEDVPEPHTDAIWADYPRFHIVVDSDDGDYVEATVTRSNDHPRAPDHGSTLAKSKRVLNTKERYIKQ